MESHLISWPEIYGFTIGGGFPVVVVKVKEGSVAQKAGLLPGDQILGIDDNDVKSFSKEEVISCAKRSRHIPPAMSVISRIRYITLLNEGLPNYGLTFKGTGPVYVYTVEKNTAAFHLDVQAGDILVELNGVRVNGSSKDCVEKLLMESNVKANLLLIAGAVNINKTRKHERDTENIKKSKLHEMVDYCLVGEEKKKDNLANLLYVYTISKNVNKLANGLNLLLTNSIERQLIPFIRMLLSASDHKKFDKVFAGSNRKRMVCISRESGDQPFGIVLFDQSPVIVHSVVHGKVADRFGIESGDVFLEINGINVRYFGYMEVVNLLYSSGLQTNILLLRQENWQEPSIQDMSTEFKQQMKMRLSHGEQLVLKQALVRYLFNKNLTDLFEVLQTLLDEPYKMQLVHYLSCFLPEESSVSFERHAKQMLAYQSEQKKDDAILNEEHKLVSEQDLFKIQKGSTLDILLSLDDEVLDNIKVDQMKKPANNGVVKTTAIVHSSGQKKVCEEKHGNITSMAGQTSKLKRHVMNDNDGVKKEYSIEHFPVARSEENRSQTITEIENVSTGRNCVEGIANSKQYQLAGSNISKSTSSKSSCYPISPASPLAWLSQTHSAQVSPTSPLIEFSQTHSEHSPPCQPPSLPSGVLPKIMPPPPPPPPPTTTITADVSERTSVLSPPPPPPPPLPALLSEREKMAVSGHLKTMRLKRLNWEKLRTTDLKNTVWNEMGDGAISDMMNFEELEKLFSKNNSKPPDKREKTKKCGSILSPKKAHSLDILFAFLKLPVEKLREFFMEVDGSLLSKDHLKILLNALPDDKEKSALSKSDESSLCSADIFTKQMLLIPDYGKRLQVMVFRSEFHEKLQGIKADVENVSQACQQLRRSDKLKHILELVLAAGNYMNKSYNSVAGAGGFKISLLPKLVTMKTCDNESTLLHVIVRSLLDKKRDVLDINEELDCVPAAAKVSIQMIKEEVGEVEKGMKNLNEVLKSPTRQDANKDKFANVMSQFVNEAHHSFHELLTQYTQMQCDFQQLVQFFGDDYTKTTTEDFFGSFAVFLQHIQSTKDTLLKSQQRDLHNRAIKQRLSVSAVENRNLIKAEQRRVSLPVCSLNSHKEVFDEDLTNEMKKSSLNEIAAKVSSIPKKGTLSSVNKDSPPLVVEAWKVAVEIKPDKSRTLSPSPKPWVSPVNSPSQKRKIGSSCKEIIESPKNDHESSATEGEKQVSVVDDCGSSDMHAGGEEVVTQPLSEEVKERHEPKESAISERLRHDMKQTSKYEGDEEEIIDEISAYNAAIRASRSPQSAPKFLNLVKAKLIEERKKNEKPRLRRKITKHEQPLYARVMKETLNEYESRRRASMKRKEKSDTGSPSTRRRVESPNFISIMEEKLKENVPEVSESLDPSLRKKSISEPLYASAIRETLQDYQSKKDEQQTSLQLEEREENSPEFNEDDGRATPDFLSMLHDNLVEKELIFEDESDLNSSLTEDDPLYAMVIKAAITQNRQSSGKDSNEKPSLVSIPPPSSVNDTYSSSKSPYDGDHSCSSSDISLTSEEVNQINGRFFKTASKQAVEPTESGKFLKNGTKPALPSIPSPDYASQNKSNIDSVRAYTHGVNSLDSSSSKVIKEPRRSSLRKKESVSKQTNVCFVKKVEVINEVTEGCDDDALQNDLRTESPLKGSPDVTRKTGLTSVPGKKPTAVQNMADTVIVMTDGNLKPDAHATDSTAPMQEVSSSHSTANEITGTNENNFQEKKTSWEPPVVNRSSKPKVMKNTAKPNSTDIRHGNTALLRTIIPSPDYSPDSSPDTSPISTRRLVTSPNKSFPDHIEKNPVSLSVLNMVETPKPNFIAPIHKNLIDVYEEEYVVKMPHVLPVESEDGSSLRRISPLNWSQPEIIPVNQLPPPIVDRGKKPTKTRDKPPELLPRSPQTVTP